MPANSNRASPRIISSFLNLRLGSLALGLLLAGCSVSPAYKTPLAPSAISGSYTAGEQSATTASATGADVGGSGIAQHIAYGQELPVEWWTLFHSPELDQLIQAALRQNPNVLAAEASLREAEQNYKAVAGTVDYPEVSGQLGATRERALLTGVSPSTFTVLNAGVNVSYNFDVFGAAHKQLEGLRAAVDYQRFEVAAAYQTLVANVVTTAIRQAGLQAQLQATQEVLTAQQKQLDIVQQQLKLGAVTRATLLAQQTQVATTTALVAPLQKSLDQTRHQLAVYVGKLPSEGGLPEFTLDNLQLPAELPVSLPSNLLQQRPDIRASEALLHEASAQLGVAVANQYPQINLTGSYSVERLEEGVFSANSTLWSLGAGLTQPIFNGGSLSAKKHAAEAAYDEAEAQYRETVLLAFQNVADGLRAVDADASSLKAQADAEVLAQASLDLSSQQYKVGAVSYLALLDVQRSYQQARINLVQAQAARYSDTAALFQAVGGSWWPADKH